MCNRIKDIELLLNKKTFEENYCFDKLFLEQAALMKKKSKLDYYISELKELKDLFCLAKLDSDDELLRNISVNFKAIEKDFFSFEKENIFIEEKDKCDIFLEINSGSGGIDAQDWVSILFKMYSSWLIKNGFKYVINSLTYGEVAGFKNISIRVSGKYAYGFLKHENGVHRLVRKSPFDSNNKRHTSFASIFVYPVIDDIENIKLLDSDLKIDTFRSGGAGGQHVNTTDSAVRITHIPTRIVVQCQSERSQYQNKIHALKQLSSKLKEYNFLEKKKNKDLLEKDKLSISWGSQIRSYVIDKSIIKDLRTNMEYYNVDLVLNGFLDPFIYSIFYFKSD